MAGELIVQKYGGTSVANVDRIEYAGSNSTGRDLRQKFGSFKWISLQSDYGR